MALPVPTVERGERATRKETDMPDDIELISEEDLPELALMVDIPS
ncbi:hypothetical protein [Embleya sp. AB8]